MGFLESYWTTRMFVGEFKCTDNVCWFARSFDAQTLTCVRNATLFSLKQGRYSS